MYSRTPPQGTICTYNIMIVPSSIMESEILIASTKHCTDFPPQKISAMKHNVRFKYILVLCILILDVLT